ncbi:hypothetical protein ACLOJK_021361 [Asimina triloba]
MSVVGTIPDALASLTHLTNLDLRQNRLTGPLPAFIGNMTGMEYLPLNKSKAHTCPACCPAQRTHHSPQGHAYAKRVQPLRSDPLTGLSASPVCPFFNSIPWFPLTKPQTFLGRAQPTRVSRYQRIIRKHPKGELHVESIHRANPTRLGQLGNSATNNIEKQQDFRFNPIEHWRVSILTDHVKHQKYNTDAFFLWRVYDFLAVICRTINYLEVFLHGPQRAYNYSRFAVNCGGGAITSAGGMLFERDNENLGPATHYVTTETRWAVSNVGRFAENPNPSYIRNSSSQFSNTLDSELFQTARLSPSSLRYYGLGLENGQYTVTMQFAEIPIEESTTWRSLGRRVFDVYAQGNLQLKNFNIKIAAGGLSKQAVVRTFKVNVTENFLEIHLFWAGKGTCCIPLHGTYGPSVSAISATPDFLPTVSDRPPSTGSKKKKTGLIVGIVVGVVALSFMSVFALLIWRQRRMGIDDDEGNIDFLNIAGKPNTYSYSELRNATEDFSPANKLGEGGFGAVYKGMLSDGSLVAVKQLSVASRQATSQFVTEIATISAVQHKNLVKLYGCCIEGDKRLLVYEYLENKSLDQALFGKGKLNLDWPTRCGICSGTARGLAYLHEESRLRIVHRDVKASNILLDAELVPKISDFGLAKLYDDKKSHISTLVAGTIGYLAPEYAMRGHLTEKADVFAFGVVTLEILSGRPNQDSSLDEEKIYLLEWAWNLHENNRALELTDPTLPEFNEGEALRLIGVALLCTQASPSLRPPMSRVVAMLSGNIEVSSVTSRPGYLTDWQLEKEGNSFMTSDGSREMTATTTSATTTSTPHSGASSSTPRRGRSPKASQPMLLHEL